MHSIAGVMLDGVEKVVKVYGCSSQDVLLEWIGEQQITQIQNKIQNIRSKELYEIFSKAGFNSCVLKGQGTALYYPHPENRQCGDIDLWVEAKRDEILAFIRGKGYNVYSVDVKNAEVKFFDDVPVEIHFRPGCFYEPLIDRRWQRFYKKSANYQFAAYDELYGFAHTSNAFDLVYSIVHIYRHIFSEGIGLRQLLDYYYILSCSTEHDRLSAFQQLCRFRMASFVGGVMYILNRRMGMTAEWLLCEPDNRHGEFLLNEILISGNFGQYDHRMPRIDKQKRFERGFAMLRRNLRFVRYYPTEVLCSPFWKLWLYCWRKYKGYL